MKEFSFESGVERSRIGWWLFVALLAVAAAYIAYSFVGLLVLGVFGYYATRPICKRLDDLIGSDWIAAAITVLVVLVPIVVLALYASFQTFQQAQQFLSNTADPLALAASYFNFEAVPGEQRRALASALQNPRQFVTNPGQTVQRVLQAGIAALSALVSTLLFVALAITLSYFLLQNDDELSDGLRQLFGGRDSTAYAYASAVDQDLESVFFGNLLFVVVMSAVASAVYWGTNMVAPQGIAVPMVFVLGFLTGVASLIPIVVGKIVYLPVVAYLGFQAVNAGGNRLPFVGLVLVAYFLFLDILPQTFLQPYISGRQLDMMMMMFAYLLGPVLFGWYGFFLLPIVFIVMLETIRIVLPELLHGATLTPSTSMGESVGADPSAASAQTAPDDAAANADGSADGDGSGSASGSSGTEGTTADDGDTGGDGSAAETT